MTPRQQSTRRLAAAQAARLALFYADPQAHQHSVAEAKRAARHGQPICPGCLQARRDYDLDLIQRAKEIQP